MKTTWTMILAL